MPGQKIFRPNRSKKNIRIIYFACGFFILLGLFIGSPQKMAGYYMAIFAFVLFFVAYFLTTPPNVFYAIGAEGITLRAWTKTLLIPFKEIESIYELKENQAEELMLKRKRSEEQEEATIFHSEQNPLAKTGAAFSAQAKAFSPYKFLSAPIVFRSSGNRNHMSGVNLPCDCVFILLKNGNGHLISPLDTEGFVNEAKKYIL